MFGSTSFAEAPFAGLDGGTVAIPLGIEESSLCSDSTAAALDFALALDSAIELSDSYAGAVAFAGAVAETVSGSSVLDTVLSAFAQQAESATFVDALQNQIDAYMFVIEETVATDARAATAEFYAAISSVVDVLDSLARRLSWELINDNQSAQWQNVGDAQSAQWQNVGSQTAGSWQKVTTAQPNAWGVVDTEQPPDWTNIPNT